MRLGASPGKLCWVFQIERYAVRVLRKGLNVASAHATSGARAPRVSIGLPVYNGETYLEAALDSLLGQTFSDFELIVADNASTDRSPEICAHYAARDPRIHYLRNEANIGGFANANLVMKRARGELFLLAAHDDIRQPRYIERCVATLDEHPNAVLCYTRTDVIDEDSEPTGYEELRIPVEHPDPAERFRAMIRLDYRIEPIYGLMRREVLLQTNLQAPYPDSDRVLVAELGLHGPFVRLPEALFLRREHGDRSIRQFPSRQERAQWIHAGQEGRLAFPYHRQLVELFRSVRRARLPVETQFRCYGHIAVWALRHRRQLLSDLDFNGRQLLRPLVRRIC